MEWPYRRFLKAFDSFQRRLLMDEWRARKCAHLAALYSNTNLDDERNDRASIVERLEQTYEDVIAKIWNGGPTEEEKQVEEQAWTSPFMRAGKTAMARLDETAKQVGMVKKSAVAIKPQRPFVMPGEAEIGFLPG